MNLAYLKNKIQALICADVIDENTNLRSATKKLEYDLKRLDTVHAETTHQYRTMSIQLDALKNELLEAKFRLASVTKPSKLTLPMTSLVYTKRWIIDKNKTKLPLNVCDFVRPSLTLKNKLTVKDCFLRRVKYVTDIESYNMLDVWQFPEETDRLRIGDCDDSASYKLSLIKSSTTIIKSEQDKYFVALGFAPSGEGHAFVVYVDSDDERLWSAIEPTTNSYKPIDYTGSGYVIHYLFNERDCYALDTSISFGALVEFSLTERALK